MNLKAYLSFLMLTPYETFFIIQLPSRGVGQPNEIITAEIFYHIHLILTFEILRDLVRLVPKYWMMCERIFII